MVQSEIYFLIIFLQLLSIVFDKSTKQVKEMTNLETSLKIPLNQGLMYYFGFQGNNSKDEFRTSGAYVFRPNETEPRTMVVQNAYIVQVILSVYLKVKFSRK